MQTSGVYTQSGHVERVWGVLYDRHHLSGITCRARLSTSYNPHKLGEADGVHAHFTEEETETQRGKVCLREGPFSIRSSDSGARGPSTPRDALSLGCGVRGVRAECLGVLRPLCPESGPGGEWRGAGRFRLGAARLQERRPLLLPPPLPHPAGLPRSRSQHGLPNAWKLASRSPTAPGHPPASAQTAPPVPPKQVASP